MIDVALATLLRGVAGVDNRVTPGTETLNVTKGLPRVVYSVIDDRRSYTDSGVCALRRAHYQLDVFAPAMTAGRTVINKIAARADAPTPGLDGYRGTVDQTVILRIAFTGERVTQGVRIEGQDQVIARCILDLIIWYRETL